MAEEIETAMQATLYIARGLISWIQTTTVHHQTHLTDQESTVNLIWNESNFQKSSLGFF